MIVLPGADPELVQYSQETRWDRKAALRERYGSSVSPNLLHSDASGDDEKEQKPNMQ